MKYIVVIPARLKSTRLPGKPLVDIGGKSLIQRTYEQCIQAVPKELVYVATEDQSVADHCASLSINSIMTSESCLTGTDRVAEVANIIDADYYINVQGDEPLLNPNDIKEIIEAIENFPGEIINGYCTIHTSEHYQSLSIPKVVFRPDGRLLYMSRAPIPGNKSLSFKKAWRQVCVYGFPKEALLEFANSAAKSPLEDIEDIEILRFLELGRDVRMIELSDDSIAVDNPEDIDLVLKKLSSYVGQV